MSQDFLTFIGRFHPLWVHLPIGFLLLAILLKGYVVLRKKPGLQEAVSFSFLLGAISALIAAVLGFILSQSGGYEGELLDYHLIAGWSTVVLASFAYWVNKNEHRFSKKLNYSLLGILILSLSITGHFGGSLTHGEDYLTDYAPFFGEKGAAEARVLASLEEAEVFTDVIQPILRSKCQSCHRPGKSKGDLNMVSYETLLKGGENGPVILPIDNGASELIRRVTLPEDHEDFMPSEGKKPLSEEEIQWIRWWIEKGSADPKVSIMEADEELIAWAEPKLTILGAEKLVSAAIDTAQIRQLESLGFRIRVLSPETGALDVVLTREASKGQASKLLESLQPIKDQIYWLSLANNGISDSDLSIISSFSNLRRLRIENNPVSDVGIRRLKSLSRLEVLNLNGTKITEASLESLTEIKTLQSLYLWNTSVKPQDDWVKKINSNQVKVVFGS